MRLGEDMKLHKYPLIKLYVRYSVKTYKQQVMFIIAPHDDDENQLL